MEKKASMTMNISLRSRNVQPQEELAELSKAAYHRRRNDNLSRIAQRYGTTAKLLK